ncbi:MAG: penicillin-binding protein 2 [Candidatus Moraniibacteriota bacterium]|nr:MAG: penicillin-binding protein 2 [Candidatus Moranbacteria bacterium]
MALFTKNDSHEKKVRNTETWRMNLLAFSFLLFFLVIVFRLYVLQIKDASFYAELAKNQHAVSSDLLPKRGEIFLREKDQLYPLAVNRVYFTVYAVPKEVKNVEETTRFLGEVFGQDKNDFKKFFENENDPFEVIEKKVSEEISTKIKESKLPGLYTVNKLFRYYPGEELAAQTVGFVSGEDSSVSGKYGIEAFLEEELRGSVGSIRQERDSRGRWISIADREYSPAVHGSDIVLSLDAGVQYHIERVLRERVLKHEADGASAIVLEAGTGKILAMANVPTFDPNVFSDIKDLSSFMNTCVSNAYESGSVFKPLTLAMGIDAGKITSQTTYTDTGAVTEAGYTIKNSDEKSYGNQTMKEVLEKSLNTGTIFVQKQLGNVLFRDYVKRFGFGEKTGIWLPTESKGSIMNLENTKSTINFYTASFGQGISMTLLQLALAYDVIANGGILMKPQIVDHSIQSDGTNVPYQPEEVRRVISEGAAKEVREMLYSVVKNGHGKKADVPGYRVGGKTGTAQVAKSDARGYSEDETIGSFAGLAPIEDPRFVVVVKIRNPKDVIWAESSAGPAFKEIMQFLLEYYNVEPTEILENNKE